MYFSNISNTISYILKLFSVCVKIQQYKKSDFVCFPNLTGGNYPSCIYSQRKQKQHIKVNYTFHVCHNTIVGHTLRGTPVAKIVKNVFGPSNRASKIMMNRKTWMSIACVVLEI